MSDNPFGFTDEELKAMEEQERVAKADRTSPENQKRVFRLMGARDQWGKLITDKPKRMKKELEPNKRGWTELNFQKMFDAWFPKNAHLFPTCLIELKASSDTSIPFRCFEESQERALRDVQTESGVYHRIESAPHGHQSAKPSDSFFMRSANAYVAVMFRKKERGNFTFYIIPYQVWLAEETVSVRKSLTEERAGEIGTKYTL